MTGMDHLVPPLADDQPMFEAIVTTTWLAAHTERLRLGSLVLCDAFRHPAVLARQAVSIDHASGGRFDLGIGWGSVPDELATFGVGSTEARDRVDRLRETLEVVRAVGRRDRRLRRPLPPAPARQEPRPLGHIPIVIGGTGPKTLALVREFADWWNVHIGHAAQDRRAAFAGRRRARVDPADGRPDPARRRPRRDHRARATTVRLLPPGDRFRTRAGRALRAARRPGHRARLHVVLRLRAARDTLAAFGEEVVQHAPCFPGGLLSPHTAIRESP